MKTFPLVFIAFALSFNSYSQDVTLTKGETIQYLDKIVKQTVGQTFKTSYGFLGNSGTIGEVKEAYIKETSTGIEVFYEIKGSFIWQRKLKFHPKYIKTIINHKNNLSSTVNGVDITLIGNLCNYEYYARDYGGVVGSGTVAQLSIIFLQEDPKNFERLKKALLHLQALYKAEDDPFDN